MKRLFRCTLLIVMPLSAWSQESRDLRREAVNRLPSAAKRWALIVGVDQYDDAHIGRLAGAANDARALADALAVYAGFPRDQIIVLATGEPPERQPTRINILRRLSNLRGLVPNDGLFLFSFSGHGIERGGKGFLIPSDAQLSDDIEFLQETGLSLDSVTSRIRGMKTTQALLLIDACRNDPGGRADADNPLSQKFVDSLRFDVRNHEVEAFAVLYAASVGQRAYEDAEKKQGYFTWALVQGLRGEAANKDGDVTLAGLVSYLQNTIPKRIALDLGGKSQRPYAVIEGYRADTLVLASAPKAPAAPVVVTVLPTVVSPAVGPLPVEATKESRAAAVHLLEQAREAMGGSAKIAGIRNVDQEVQNTIPRIGGGVLKMIKAHFQYCDGTYREEQRILLAEHLTLYFDGASGGWIRSHGKSEPLRGSLLKTFQNEKFLEPYGLVQADLRGNIVAITDPSTLHITDQEGNSANLTFDPATHLPKTVRHEKATYRFADWRTVSGTQYPFEIEVVSGQDRPVVHKVMRMRVNTGIKCADLGKK